MSNFLKKKKQQNEVRRTNNDGNMVSISCVVVFFLLMIAVTVLLPMLPHEGWRIFGQTLLSTIATILLATGVWEIMMKKRFADYVLNLVHISENIEKSGIDTVYIDFNKINWENEFKNTESFTAAFVYARTWRESNSVAIKEFASDKEHLQRMKIIVPDPDNAKVMADLDRRFGFKEGVTKERVEECITFFDKLDVSVYLFEGTLQSSYYLMDRTAIMSFFSHSKEKGPVPVIRASKPGNMFEYIRQDVAILVNRSRKYIAPSKAVGKDNQADELRENTNE